MRKLWVLHRLMSKPEYLWQCWSLVLNICTVIDVWSDIQQRGPGRLLGTLQYVRRVFTGQKGTESCRVTRISNGRWSGLRLKSVIVILAVQGSPLRDKICRSRYWTTEHAKRMLLFESSPIRKSP